MAVWGGHPASGTFSWRVQPAPRVQRMPSHPYPWQTCSSEAGPEPQKHRQSLPSSLPAGGPGPAAREPRGSGKVASQAPRVAFRQIQEARISRPRSSSPSLLSEGLCLCPVHPSPFHGGPSPICFLFSVSHYWGFIGDASRKYWVQTSFCLGTALGEGPWLPARPPRGQGRRGRCGAEPAGPESALFRRPGPRTVSESERLTAVE